MKTISVTASRSYPVMIGTGLIHSIGGIAAEQVPPCKAAIISDSNVWPIYGATVQESLIAAGFAVISYTFPAGESSKSGKTLLTILDFLAQNEMTRSDLIIALGGGVVGDISGFAASVYLRGIPYLQIPTSLLAMVDSSVGGKTAIDLPSGKNLAGAFYQPKAVICDLDSLKTLPEEYFIDGCAEVIKYSILFDSVLFDHLESFGKEFNREYVIARCIELKRDVVAQDEFDTGLRQKLNLGHTIGHAVEVQSSFKISHGHAVAIGTAIIARSAAAGSFCEAESASRICNILNAFKLPVNTEFSAEQLYHSALSDKKRSGGTINLIVPQRIGSCVIQRIPVSSLQSYIEAGL